MVDDTIEVGNGITIKACTEEDMLHIQKNLRDEDRLEVELVGDDFDRIEDFVRVWTIWDRGNIVGYIGTMTYPNESFLSKRRFIAELTTKYVDTIKFHYAKMSRAVLKAVVGATAPWVNEFHTMPMKSYRKSIEWQTRILGFHIVKEIDINGVKHILMCIKRKEVLG